MLLVAGTKWKRERERERERGGDENCSGMVKEQRWFVQALMWAQKNALQYITPSLDHSLPSNTRAGANDMQIFQLGRHARFISSFAFFFKHRIGSQQQQQQQ